MKKLLVFLVLFGLLAINIFAQSGRKTRPRIVKEPKSPPVIQDDNSNSDRKRPPVLIGDEEIGPPPPLPPDPNATYEEEEDDIIKIETNLVTMPVSVLDRNGRFISGLQQRDFRVFENGIEQEIGFFQKVETPFTVVLMIDVSPSTQYKINEIQNAAIAFTRQLRPTDRVMVLEFDDRVNILARPTNNRSILESAIRRARFGDGTSLYDAVDQVISRELRYIEGRKAIVLFTDGVDTTSKRSGYTTTLRQVEEVDALIYPIRYDTSSQYGRSTPSSTRIPRGRRGRTSGIGGILADILGGIVIGGNPPRGGRPAPGSTRGEYETGRRYLEELARYSGGRKFEANTTYNLDAAFRGIAEELRQQYSIGYYPLDPGEDGERKSIRVRVMRPGVVVRAKNSYIVRKNNDYAGN